MSFVSKEVNSKIMVRKSRTTGAPINVPSPRKSKSGGNPTLARNPTPRKSKGKSAAANLGTKQGGPKQRTPRNTSARNLTVDGDGVPPRSSYRITGSSRRVTRSVRNSKRITTSSSFAHDEDPAPVSSGYEKKVELEESGSNKGLCVFAIAVFLLLGGGIFLIVYFLCGKKTTKLPNSSIPGSSKSGMFTKIL